LDGVLYIVSKAPKFWSLKDEILNRQQSQRHFSSRQLLGMAEQLGSALQ